MTDPEPPAAKRRAPAANRSARKRGLYLRQLAPDKRELFERARSAYALVDEIALMRVKLDELLHDPDLDPKLLLLAMTVLSRMVLIDDRVRYGPGG